MILLAALAMLLTSSMALPTGTVASPDRPCCPPTRWQGELIDLKKISTGLQYVTYFAMDEDMQVEASLTVDRVSGAQLVRTYDDYNSMVRYQVESYGANAGKCVKNPLDHPMYEICERHPNSTAYAMPNGMTGYAKLGNGTIGGVGVGSEFDAWSFSYSDGMKVTITLNRNGCIPVVESAAQPSKQIDAIFLFNNIETKVDAKSLALPPECAGLDTGVVG